MTQKRLFRTGFAVGMTGAALLIAAIFVDSKALLLTALILAATGHLLMFVSVLAHRRN